jgi:putative membrane protein
MTGTFATALGAFLANLVVALALMAGFILLYTRITPPDELKLIRSGNGAATVSLAGAAIGFAIVLSRAVMVSNSLSEVAIWGLIGLAVQVAGFRLASLFVPTLSGDINAGNIPAGVLSAAAAISLGLVNAACMTP